MGIPLIEAGCTAAVLLGLYAFLCYWEAARADLAGAARSRLVQGDPGGAGYRVRARVALAGCGAIAMGLVARAL
jgi:hypothetical protein